MHGRYCFLISYDVYVLYKSWYQYYSQIEMSEYSDEVQLLHQVTFKLFGFQYHVIYLEYRVSVGF